MRWTCPSCQQPLSVRDDNKGLACQNNHQFDYAKQGYVNLLLADQKSSKNPGDNPEMIQARHRFLQQGFYLPLVERIAHHVNQRLDHVLAHKIHSTDAALTTLTLLDSGCGEGYYSRELAALIEQNIALYAFDISKAAVKKAAGLHKQASAQAVLQHAHSDKGYDFTAFFGVASSFNIPVQANSIDVALSVFAPFDEASVLATLAPNGIFIRVLPSNMHLQQLKSEIYQQANEHKAPKPLLQLQKIAQEHVTFTAHLTPTAYTQLRAMTPFNFSGNKNDSSSMNHQHTPQEQQATQPMTCDFILEVFTRHDNR